MDRGGLTTERRNPASAEIDTLDAAGILRVIHDADRSVADAVGAVVPRLATLVEAAVDALERGGRLIYVGAGTSGRLGVLDASEVPPTFHEPTGDGARIVGVIAGGDAALRQSSEGLEDDPDGAVAELERVTGRGGGHVVMGIAAGGTTPYVHGGLRWAKGRGVTTALLCCIDERELRDAVGTLEHIDHALCLPVGPEVIAGSTRMKAGTATKMVLNMLSTAVMVRLGKTWGHLMIDVRATNAKLRDRATRLLMQQCRLPRDAAATLLSDAGGSVKRAVVMAGRGVDAAEADRLLAGGGGRLREVVGGPGNQPPKR